MTDIGFDQACLPLVFGSLRVAGGLTGKGKDDAILLTVIHVEVA